MRHFLQKPDAVTALASGVLHAAIARVLVALACVTDRRCPRQVCASRAKALAAVAWTAHRRQRCAEGAPEGTRGDLLGDQTTLRLVRAAAKLDKDARMCGNLLRSRASALGTDRLGFQSSSKTKLARACPAAALRTVRQDHKIARNSQEMASVLAEVFHRRAGLAAHQKPSTRLHQKPSTSASQLGRLPVDGRRPTRPFKLGLRGPDPARRPLALWTPAGGIANSLW